MTARLLSFAAEGRGLSGSQVCVAIAGLTVEELLALAERVLPREPLVELRLDALAEPGLAIPGLAGLLARFPQAQVIATCRRREAGGGFPGSVENELVILEQAARAGCTIVDLALESAEAMRLEQHRALRHALDQAGALLQLSYHDYRGTRDLALNTARLLRHQPAIVKVVSTANSLADNLPILALMGQQHGCPVVAVAMGEAGLLSRVLGPRAGSLFTFAASSACAPTAPGQIDVATLRDLYRIDEIGPSTRVYGVAGKPVAQSLSPLLHNTAFASQGVDAIFLPLATDSVDDLLRVARELPLAGLSVTMPLKQIILPLLDHVDPLAARVGACNTVVRTAGGELHGYNTDVAAVTAPLLKRLDLKGARVLVQGAGGAARAAVFGVLDEGAEVWIANRTAATAATLAAESGARLADPALLATEKFDVLINATPVGMGAQGGAPVDEAAPIPASMVFEMVYRPLETPLVTRARAQGLPVITGAEMFVQQGARQFELWTGGAAPHTEMWRVVLDALGSSQAEWLITERDREEHGQI